MSLEKKENAMTQEKAIAIAKDFFQQIDANNIQSEKSGNPFDLDLTRYFFMQGRAYKYSIEEYIGAMKHLLAEEGVNIETTQAISFKNSAGQKGTSFSLSEDQIYLAKVKCGPSAKDGRFVARKNTEMPEFLGGCQNNLAEILLKAVSVGNSHVADSILGQGALKETRNQALFIAIGRNHPDVVRLLLDYNADVNQLEKNLRGRTPLIHAIMLGRHECVKTLLKKGADLQQTFVTKEGRKTALQIAIRNKNNEVIKTIFDYHNDTKKLGVLNDLLAPLSKEEQALFLPYLYQQRKQTLADEARFPNLFGSSEDDDLFPTPPTSAAASRSGSPGSNHKKEEDPTASSSTQSSAPASPAADLPPPPPLKNLSLGSIQERAKKIAQRAAAIQKSLETEGVDERLTVDVKKQLSAVFGNVARANDQLVKLTQLPDTYKIQDIDIQKITDLLMKAEAGNEMAEALANSLITPLREQQAALANTLEMLQLSIDKARDDFDAAEQDVLPVINAEADADPDLIQQTRSHIDRAKLALAQACTAFTALKDAKERGEPIKNPKHNADGILVVLEKLNSLIQKARDGAQTITHARIDTFVKDAARKADQEAAAQAEAIARAAAKEKAALVDSLIEIVSAIEKEIPKAQAAVAMARKAAVKTAKITPKLSDQTIQATEAVYAATLAAEALFAKVQEVAHPPTSEALREIITQATDTHLSLQQAVVNAYRAATHAHTEMARLVVKAARKAVKPIISAATAKQPEAVDIEEKSEEEVKANGTSTFVDRFKAVLAERDKKTPMDAEVEFAEVEAKLIAAQNKVEEAKRVLKTATTDKTTAEAEKGAADKTVEEAKALLETATAEKVRIEAEKAVAEKPVEEAAAVQASATELAKKLWTRVKAGKSPADKSPAEKAAIQAVEEASEKLATATKAAENASKKLATATKAAEKATADVAAAEEAAKTVSDRATMAREAADTPWLEREASVDDHSAQAAEVAAKAIKAAKKAAKKAARIAASNPDPAKAAKAASKAARAAKESAAQAYLAVGAPLPAGLKKIKTKTVEIKKGVDLETAAANEAKVADVADVADLQLKLQGLTSFQKFLLDENYELLREAAEAKIDENALFRLVDLIGSTKAEIAALEVKAKANEAEVAVLAAAVTPNENPAPHQQAGAAEELFVGEAAVESVAQNSPSSSSTPTSGVAASLSNLFSSMRGSNKTKSNSNVPNTK